ncbi:PREDICTED: ankyrin repeat and SAM domain-containing protein 6 [Fragaria vesca subsp. vesca]|uniref:ankyrin repeat and SAM domain-containing protein 6 n=1 Tax=Fragaria vesca subsp. vesca TaxID=101020 RepID=UPI0002C3516A|nr:PREDICTED: ankyrin repeat and SAM domain-containing protein 6 [Fragaria vesca subsp. vesca]
MSGSSRGNVTITLGRGQVVKRSVTGSGAESLPTAGAKRSVRDRLGSNADSSVSNGSSRSSNKRQRGHGGMSSMNSNGFDDARIGKDDLRFKLMQKNAFRRALSDDDDDQRHGDLREKLTKAVQRPVPSVESRAQQRLPEPQESGFFSRVSSTRSADDLPHMDSLRNSYSPWTLDHLRRRSPERVQVTYRGLSPQRNVEDLQRRPLNRTYDDVRSVPYMKKDVLDATRPATTAPFMSNTALPPGPAKHMAPVPPHMNQVPPLSSTVQKPPYVGDEQQTVDGLLQHLGLGKYAIIFKAEEIDMTALKQMGENDLKELGIPMGPRKKLLLALLPHSKRPLATNLR